MVVCQEFPLYQRFIKRLTCSGKSFSSEAGTAASNTNNSNQHEITLPLPFQSSYLSNTLTSAQPSIIMTYWTSVHLLLRIETWTGNFHSAKGHTVSPYHPEISVTRNTMSEKIRERVLVLNVSGCCTYPLVGIENLTFNRRWPFHLLKCRLI